MEITSVNWMVLDALVMDYAEADQLVDEAFQNSGENLEIREGIERIRSLIEEGCITEALHMIPQFAPAVLEDQRLLFRLHKQKFIELLRTGTPGSRLQAIQCSREVLGPCALNAYPEAYEEFKQILLALIYNKDDESSPVVEQWSEKRRKELAATAASILKAQLHAYDPTFLLTLRYLLSTHNNYCFRQGVASPIAQIAERILIKERDPPATPQESLLEAPNFSESDVQALAHAVDLPRQGAIDSIRYAGGDLTVAFKNELNRWRLNINVVDELVREYCVYRGLVECSVIASGCKGATSDGVFSELSCSKGNELKEFSNDTINAPGEFASEAETIDIPEQIKGYECDTITRISGCEQDMTKEIVPDLSNEVSLHSGKDEATLDECMTINSYSSTVDTCSSLEEMESKVGRGKEALSLSCKKWIGRQNDVRRKKLQDSSLVASCRDMLNLEILDHGDKRDIKITVNEEKPQEMGFEKYKLVLEIRELESKGMTNAVIEKVNDLNQGFFDHNPYLLFQLKQVEFLKLVEEGNFTQALRVARADMGPLASKYPDLLKLLKETILALLHFQDDTLVKSPSPFMLGAALQVALTSSLGIAEPTLMKVMKATLHSHTEWFKLQMCTDPFAEVLQINALKETELTALSSVSHKSTQDSNTGISSWITGSTICTHTCVGNDQQLDSSRETSPFDERAILTVMEWMALPRGDAIQLLAQYDGSIDNMFAHILS